ncbi:MAG: response regulator [Acidobacteria bacterium]|nr:response regulator [Acidobacteriota bacterium]
MDWSSEAIQRLEEHYRITLQDYLRGAEEEALCSAYNLGREAMRDGVGLLQMLSVHQKSLEQALSDPTVQREFEHVRARVSTFLSESLAPFEMVLRGFIDTSNALRHHLSKLQTAEEELAQERRQRSRAERERLARDEFLAALSHELRTPLMIVLGWTRVLGQRLAVFEDEVLKEGIRSLEHNVQMIIRLVNDCLDLERVTEGRIELMRESVEVNRLVRSSVDAVRALTDEKGLGIEIQLSPASLWVSGDRTRLEQVLMNLLTNSIKYTHGGVISICTRALQCEAEIGVTDTGIGIPPELLEDIFSPFRRGTLSDASQSGLGLGLAIARYLVESHGGRIWAESPGPGQGSTFVFRLPLSVAPAGMQISDRETPPPPGRAKNVRVLFIEDSSDARNLMKIELETAGYTVLLAGDGETGLEMAKRESPDIIVSDIKMPGMDGHELVKLIRASPELSSIPAIALSGYGMRRDVELALEAGYNAHICKPPDLEEMVALIDTLVAGNAGEKRGS